MYSFFDLSSTKAARVIAGTGTLIITVILIAGAVVPATFGAIPDIALLTNGVLA